MLPIIDFITPDEIFKVATLNGVTYENYYISNYGRLYSKNVEKILSPKLNRDGYIEYRLSVNGKIVYTSGHRLVAFAFVENPKPNEYDTVNHKDEKPHNNYYLNLEWCDDQYNLTYGTAQDRRAAKRSKAVKQFDEFLNHIATYKSLPEASKSNNISINPIWQGCHDGKLHMGYYWQYV